MTDGRKSEYIYDVAGIKLEQRVYEDKTKPATKTTDYIGERVYETTNEKPIELQFIHHEEGRVVPKEAGDGYEYQYFLKDHLGNTRLTFGEAKTQQYLLTMEVDPEENRIIEAEEFENVYESEYNRLPKLNHTPKDSISAPNPEYVIFLNGTDRVIGPSKSLKVLPGDHVEIEAYAKYLHLDTYDPSVAGDILLSSFMGAFLKASSEFLINNQYVDEGLLAGLESIPTSGKNYDGVPNAYINYILFDKEYNVVEAKKLQISDEGKFNVGDTVLGPHEYLHIDPIAIAKEGYIYIYLSNETPGSEVYFDDLLITHTQSRVIQKDDYYPFGLSIASLSSTRENSLVNKWKFQGQEQQIDFDLNWYSFKWRNHQPEIGRFFNIDPLSDKYVYNSPYAFSENKVTAHIELEGLESIRVITPLPKIDKNIYELFNQPDRALSIVTSYKGYINKSAKKYNVSAQSIASIIFQEKAAGWRGELSNTIAEVIKDNNTLSLGLGEMQVGLAAKLMGMNPDDLTDEQREAVKDALNDPEKSIDLIAQNVKDMEEYVGRELTVEEATYGHNVGKKVLKEEIDSGDKTSNRVSNRSKPYQEEISSAIEEDNEEK